jgi:hypothetical protein
LIKYLQMEEANREKEKPGGSGNNPGPGSQCWRGDGLLLGAAPSLGLVRKTGLPINEVH